MEEVHRNHKDTAWNWLGALVGVAPRIRRRTRPASPKLVVTPWSGRSPKGWSA